MTYAEWLRDEMPKLLEGTEYWTAVEIEPCTKTLPAIITLGVDDIWIPLDAEPRVRAGNIYPLRAPIIAEACALIQTIEAKRREML